MYDDKMDAAMVEDEDYPARPRGEHFHCEDSSYNSFALFASQRMSFHVPRQPRFNFSKAFPSN